MKWITDVFIPSLDNIHSIWSFLTIMVLIIPAMFLIRWLFRILKDIKKENLNGNGTKAEIHHIKSETNHIKKDLCELRKENKVLFSKVNKLSNDINLIKGFLIGKNKGR